MLNPLPSKTQSDRGVRSTTKSVNRGGDWAERRLSVLGPHGPESWNSGADHVEWYAWAGSKNISQNAALEMGS